MVIAFQPYTIAEHKTRTRQLFERVLPHSHTVQNDSLRRPASEGYATSSHILCKASSLTVMPDCMNGLLMAASGLKRLKRAPAQLGFACYQHPLYHTRPIFRNPWHQMALLIDRYGPRTNVDS